MTTITDVKNIPGFDQQRYDALINDAKAQNVDVSLVTAALLAAVNKGKDFDQAVNLTTTSLPKLAKPDAQTMISLTNWVAAPAPGAVIMALITEISADQRQQNKELMWAQTEAVVDSMKDQAKEMRRMAVTQLAIGLTGAVTSAAGGIAQGIVAGGAGNAATVQAQGIGTAVGGGASALNAVNQFVGSMYQAKFKEMEADQEKMRAMRDSLKDLNDGLKELIQKSLSSAENIQQGKNQATTRILA